MHPELIEIFLDNAECEIFQKSENQIVAVKHMENGRIHVRLKRQTLTYALEERHYWLADIHFEKGLRPHRSFDSKEVKDFVEKYVKSLTNTQRINGPISLTIEGRKLLELHEKEKKK